MKPSSFSFILSLLLYICIESMIQVNADCWEHNNPLRPWEKTKSSFCGTQSKPKNKLTINQGKLEDDQAAFLAPEAAFQFVFSCGSPDQTLCTKAENSFKAAGLIIANLVNFTKPLVVNATFTPFCQALGECDGKILGAASAARTVPLQDDDNKIRQYPQALAKQFLLQPEPQWGPFDIQAFFNAEADLFFEGDTQPITPTQFDFRYIILHELVHGLGFASGWNSYFSGGDGSSNDAIALTPDPGFLEKLTGLNDPVVFTGFEETAFDKYMVNAKIKTQSPKRMTDYADSINSFAPIGTKFPSVQALLNSFQNSRSFTTSTELIGDSQTPKTFAFQTQNAKSTADLIFLETNLKPFQQGSSISHVDIVSFNNNSDFLEVFNAKRGQNLDQILSSVGGTYPIGPKLQNVLETLGYTTANNQTPYKPRLPNSPKLNVTPPPPLPVANQNGNKISASAATPLKSNFNILSVIIFVALVLLL
ncbi:hypothetical protein RclHR1_11050008 [Rhizophagus clarus]|uniref:Sequence orphan n=1 Tax=Rhizophagus clarus TaxID=94130 RepID=A0A2Z6QI52_9GLOM|nr:hypothetical protein RclHR1_11050008 [Rhizophagus clarus]GES99379.1 hypothetical protein GLOIN_2v1613522 [Rhizophagus clarus]